MHRLSIPSRPHSRPLIARALVLTLVSVTGCGGPDSGTPVSPTGPALSVDSIRPVTGDTGIDFSVQPTIFFNEALDPASLNATSLTLSSRATGIPGAISYNPVAHTATFAAPLVPGSTFVLQVSTAIHSAGGRALAAPVVATFSTRSITPTTVDSAPSVGFWATLVLDGMGGVSVLHGGPLSGVKFSACASSCANSSHWQSTFVDSTASALRHGLVRDQAGALHAVFWDVDGNRLRYARCASGCTAESNWIKGTIDPAVYVGGAADLEIDPAGTLHVVYGSYIASDVNLRYASCSSACDLTASWVRGLADTLGMVGGTPALAIDPAGHLHLAYYDYSLNRLKYAECSLSCGTVANWSRVAIDHPGDLGVYPELAIGADGTLHLVYSPDAAGRADLLYLHCLATCTTSNNWAHGVVAATGSAQAEKALAVGADSRVHVVYLSGQIQEYATCPGSCDSPSAWEQGPLSPGAPGHFFPSIRLDTSGRLHAVFTDDALQYVEFP